MQVDHKGNTFKDIPEMCKFWNVSKGTYDDRHRKGWTLKECLTGKSGYRERSDISERTDHTGRVFNNIKEMCSYWGVNYSAYISRRRHRNWSIEKSLTYDSSNENLESRTDHLGNVYASKKEMLSHYGITEEFYTSKKYQSNSTKEEILSNTYQYRNNPVEARTDHEGVVYRSISDMCNKWDIPEDTYLKRLESGWEKKDALEKDVKVMRKEVIDPFGIVFKSETEMCKFHKRSVSSYRADVIRGADELESLGIIPHLNIKLKDYKVDNNLYVQKCFMKYNCEIYFVCIYKKEEELFSREELLQYCKSNLQNIFPRC